MRAWLALFSAIAFEVTGTLTLKLSALHNHNAGVLVTYVFLALSYALLSVAFRRIPVAVAFAVWEAVGLALVTVAGVVLLGEQLSPMRVLALAGLGLGAWLLHGGTAPVASKVILRKALPTLPVFTSRAQS
ncbi:DMT family transporter [Deinococcus sp.]|uniref:DMT family transporter n=1 Tax=Deinococcus sp. TaxID=47478 RepID=UPI003C7BB017